MLFILWKTFLACLTGEYCIINNKKNCAIFFSHSLLTLIRKYNERKEKGEGDMIMLHFPYIGSGCVANETDYTEDKLLIQW